MGPLEIHNSHNCTINIHFNSSGGELQDVNNKVTEMVSNGEFEGSIAIAEQQPEQKSHPASTKHPSDSYMECYETTNNGTTPWSFGRVQDSFTDNSRNEQSSDSDGARKHFHDSNNEKESEHNLSLPDTATTGQEHQIIPYNHDDKTDSQQQQLVHSDVGRNYSIDNSQESKTSSLPRRLTQNVEIQQQKRKIVSDTAADSSCFESYKEKKLDNETFETVKEEKVISENRGVPSIEKEQCLLELNDVTVKITSPESIPEDFSESLNHLHFTTCIGERSESMTSNLNESCQTFNKEVAGEDSRQLQEFLKDTEEDESSCSIATEYPVSATWLSNYQRAYSVDTESCRSEPEGDVIQVDADTDKMIEKSTCNDGSASCTNSIEIHDESPLNSDSKEEGGRCNFYQLQETNLAESYLIDLHCDNAIAIQKREGQGTKVQHLEEIEESCQLRYVDFLLIADLENLDDCYCESNILAGGEWHNNHIEISCNRTADADVCLGHNAIETSLIDLSIDTDTVRIDDGHLTSSLQANINSVNSANSVFEPRSKSEKDEFQTSADRVQQGLDDQNEDISKGQSDSAFELSLISCNSQNTKSENFESENERDSVVITPNYNPSEDQKCDKAAAYSGFTSWGIGCKSSNHDTSTQSEESESGFASQQTSSKSFPVENDRKIYPPEQFKPPNGQWIKNPEIMNPGYKEEIKKQPEQIINMAVGYECTCTAAIGSKLCDSGAASGCFVTCALKPPQISKDCYQEYCCEQCIFCHMETSLQMTCQSIPNNSEIYASTNGKEGGILSPMQYFSTHCSQDEQHSESMRNAGDNRGFILDSSVESYSDGNVFSHDESVKFSLPGRKMYRKRLKRKTNRRQERTRTKPVKSNRSDTESDSYNNASFSSLSNKATKVPNENHRNMKFHVSYRKSSKVKSSIDSAGFIHDSNCCSSSESSDSPVVTGRTKVNRSGLYKMSGLKQTAKEKHVAVGSRCNYCNILLSIPNTQCKRHKPTRVPLSEENNDFGNVNNFRMSSINLSDDLKNGELAQSATCVDSGIGTGQKGSRLNPNDNDTTFHKHVVDTNENHAASSLDNEVLEDFTKDSMNKIHECSYDLSDTELFGIGGKKSCHSSIDTENSRDFRWANVDKKFKISCGIGSKYKGTELQKRKKERFNKGNCEMKVEKYPGKVIKRCQRKVLEKTFPNGIRQHVKSIVSELHVEHRHLPVFGLGAYFDRLNNGPPPTTQEQMQYEWLRLASFQNYTGNGNALALSRNGFYHDHTEGPSSTRCFLCGTQNTNWEMFSDVEEEHRRRSPNCPLHGNSDNESLNVSITYGDTPAGPSSSTAGSTIVSLPSSVASTAAAVTQVARSLETTNIHSRSSGGESIPQQPTEDAESRDRSMLALSQPRSQRVLGRTGHSYSTIIAPRKNNVATGARSNVGLETPGSGSSTSGTPSQLPGIRLSSILAGPVGAGAFNAGNLNLSGPNTETRTPVSTATEALQGNSAAPPAAAPTSGTEQAASGSGPGGRADTTSTVVINNPKHPDYLNIDARINSYVAWPDYLDQTPRQMSEAGFFFVGVADFTRCFCCGGGLRNWEPGDDPMLEHTRWFPRCEYVNKLKGERYVAAVQRRHQEHMAEQQRQQIELAQRRDENRNPQDPMTTDAAAVMREMGYSVDRTREAILAVRQQTGSSVVTTQQVLTWLLDDEDRRTNGSRPPTSTSVPSSVINTSVPSSIIYTGSSIASSLVHTGTSIGTSIVNATSSISTATSIVSAGTTTSTVSSTSTETTAKVQQTGTLTTAQTENQQTEASQAGTITGAMSNSSSSSGGGSVEKQSGASGGDSDESKSTATEGASSSAPTGKSTKKKNAKKKAKSKAGIKSETAGATGEGIDAKSLKAENEKLREMQTCKICMERPVNTTLLPCGHLVCCESCASRLQRCPICRKRIKGTVKTFMS